jgi:secreted trypsin-like serine protease
MRIGMLARTAAACLVAAAVVAPQASAYDVTSQPRVIGGKEADPGEFGFVASVLSAPRFRQLGAYQAQYCAASLTSPTTLITAAHCLVDQQTGERLRPRDLLIAFGSDLRSSNVRIASVQDFAVHPAYRVKTAENDIAVIYLSEPASDFPTIQLAQGAEVAAYDSAGTAAQVAGWGNTRAPGNRFLPELQVGSLRVFPDAACGRGKPYEVNGVRFDGFTKREVNSLTMLCAAGASPAGDVIDACQGDSGGPLTAGVGNGRRLIGVVSWGQQCASKLPGVYTRMSAESDFLIDAGVIPLQPPILAPSLEISTPSPTSARIRFTAPADGTRVNAFAVTATDPATGEVFTCTSAPKPNRRTATCVIDGIPTTGQLQFEAISGNSSGNSPVSRPSVLAR